MFALKNMSILYLKTLTPVLRWWHWCLDLGLSSLLEPSQPPCHQPWPLSSVLPKFSRWVTKCRREKRLDYWKIEILMEALSLLRLFVKTTSTRSFTSLPRAMGRTMNQSVATSWPLLFLWPLFSSVSVVVCQQLFTFEHTYFTHSLFLKTKFI